MSDEAEQAYVDRLRDILKVGLWMTEQTLSLPGTVKVPAADCLCFTELKLSQSWTHARKYSRLGIGVKRGFLLDRGGRPVVYFQGRGRWKDRDVFLNACSKDLTDKLLHFFKPMGSATSGPVRYDYYSESEWRIIAGTGQHSSNFF